MNYQIALLGGQITPVYLGIMERKPGKVFFICSEESKSKLQQLLSVLPDLNCETITIPPYNFEEITQRTTSLLNDHPQVAWELNMTGGTKIMALASYQVFMQNKMAAFYWKSGVLYFPTDHKEIPIQATIPTNTFFKLSGNETFTSEKFEDTKREEIEFANLIKAIKKEVGFYKAQNKFIKKKKESPRTDVVVQESGFEIHWNHNGKELSIKTTSYPKPIVFKGEAGYEIAFNGRWWELITAEAIQCLLEIKELHINVQLPYESGKATKNQIDILLNLGTSLLFVECKSGQINADDLNKMKAIKTIYGGIGSKTLLVTRNKPSDKMLEKCKELHIDFWSENVHGNGAGFDSLIQKIKDVSNSSEQMI